MDPRPDSPEDTDPPQSGESRQDNPAEKIINLFGGIRPTAHKLHVPVTTVQGWKKRGAIPEIRHDDIRAAAEKHGVTIDPALLAATKPPEEIEESEERQPATGEAPGVPPEAVAEAERGSKPEMPARAEEPAGPEGVARAPDQSALGEPGDVESLTGQRRAEPGTTAAAGPDAEPARPSSETGEPERPASPTAKPERPEAERPEAERPEAERPEAERPETERPEPRQPERPEREPGGGPPGREPPPPAAHGGGGRGVAWLAALIAVIAAAAGITAPIWGPQYLPEVWPGPVPGQWSEELDGALQPVRQQTEQLSEQLEGVAGTQEQVQQQLSSLASRIEAVEALVADATGVTDAQSLLGRIQELEQRLDQLPDNLVTEDRLADRLEALRARLDQVPENLVTEQALAESLDAMEGRLADAPAELLAGRLGPIAERLARLEDMPDRLGRLENRIETAASDAEALDALNARLENLSTAVNQAESRLQEIARMAEARRDADIRAEALALAAGQLRRDLASGAPFGASLATVRSLVSDQPVADELNRIDEHADSGIPTRNELAARFPAMAEQARRAERGGASDDAVDRALDNLRGLVRVRPAPGEVTGEETAAVLARAEHRVGTGNIAGAVAALEALTGSAAEAAQSWIEAARARLAAEEVLAALDAAALERLAGEAATIDAGDGDSDSGGNGGGSGALEPPEGGGAAAPADQG